MDIFSHALAGFASGSVVGRPLAGTIAGVLPDLVLGWRRQRSPSFAYRFTHAFPWLGLVFALAALCSWPVGAAVGLAFASHLALDIPTHGPLWAPRIFYPFNNWHFDEFQEWEFGNESWWIGLIVTAIWCLLCLILQMLPSLITIFG